MPKVGLHVLDGRVVLHVCGRGTTKRLMGHIGYARFFSQRLQIPLQIIAHTEGRTRRTGKKERTRIVAIRMRCDPGSHLAFQIRRHGDEIVALIRLRVSNPRIPFLAVLQGFVDSELRSVEAGSLDQAFHAGLPKGHDLGA